MLDHKDGVFVPLPWPTVAHATQHASRIESRSSGPSTPSMPHLISFCKRAGSACSPPYKRALFTIPLLFVCQLHIDRFAGLERKHVLYVAWPWGSGSSGLAWGECPATGPSARARKASTVPQPRGLDSTPAWEVGLTAGSAALGGGGAAAGLALWAQCGGRIGRTGGRGSSRPSSAVEKRGGRLGSIGRGGAGGSAGAHN